jgi:hypothetical protein
VGSGGHCHLNYICPLPTAAVSVVCHALYPSQFPRLYFTLTLTLTVVTTCLGLQHPHSLVDDCFMLELPQARYRLPREKPIPELKPKTKWETYADLKGIQKRKRTRMLYDDETQEYKPRFGYGSKGNDEPAVIVLPDQVRFAAAVAFACGILRHLRQCLGSETPDTWCDH